MIAGAPMSSPGIRIPSQDDPIFAKIKSILCGLPLLDQQVWSIDHIARELCLRGAILSASGGDGKVLPKLRHASTATVRKQLTEFRSRTASLAEKIERGGRSVRAREQLAKLVELVERYINIRAR